MTKQIHSMQLPGFTLSGNVFGIGQLSAIFQIWARRFGVTDEQSLAYICAGGDVDWTPYFKDEIWMLRMAAQCERSIDFSMLPKNFDSK